MLDLIFVLEWVDVDPDTSNYQRSLEIKKVLSDFKIFKLNESIVSVAVQLRILYNVTIVDFSKSLEILLEGSIR